MEQFKADFLEVLNERFKFDGVLNRTKFWTYTIILFLANMVLNGGLQIVGKIISNSIFSILIALTLLVLNVAVWVITLGPAIRRLRDGGFSPWLYLVVLVPCVGGIGLLVLLCLPSKEDGAVVAAPAQPAAEQPQDQPQDQPPAQN